jgi:hypothetical protein
VDSFRLAQSGAVRPGKTRRGARELVQVQHERLPNDLQLSRMKMPSLGEHDKCSYGGCHAARLLSCGALSCASRQAGA